MIFHLLLQVLKSVDSGNLRLQFNSSNDHSRKQYPMKSLSFVVSILLFTSPVMANGLFGSEVSLKTLAQQTPDSEKFYLSFEAFSVVSDEFVEFPSVGSLNNPASGSPPGFSGDLVNVAIDFGEDFVEINFDNSPPYSLLAPGQEKTYVFTFDQDVELEISSATIDTAVTTLALEAEDVRFEGNELSVKVSGLSFDTSTFVRVNLLSGNAGAISIRDSETPNFDRVIDFGSVQEPQSMEHKLVIGNDSQAVLELSISEVSAGDVVAIDSFVIVEDSCTSDALAGGDECELTVRFVPPSIGTFSGSFIVSSAEEEPIIFVLSGIGTGSPVPQIRVTDSAAPEDDLQVYFGAVVKVTDSVQSITIHNEGGAELLIGKLAVENELTEPFTISEDQCSLQTIDPGASCSIKLTFVPMTLGDFSDTFNVPSNDPDVAFTNHPQVMGKVLAIVNRAISTYLINKAGFKISQLTQVR